MTTAEKVQERPQSTAVRRAGGGGHARRERRGNLLARHPAWPVTGLLVSYPLWWALGIADYMFIVFAIPMALRMYSWQARGKRRLRLPPGFSLWLLFLICMLGGVFTLGDTAPGTTASPVSNRIIAFADRSASYLAVTALLLFAYNLTEHELSRRRLAWLLGLVGIYAVVGGFGGIVAPTFSFTSPLALVMPRSLQANTLVRSWLHPGFSQVQNVLGVAEGRPKAPFDYTDAWGNCLTILVPWLLVGWSASAGRRRLAAAMVVLAFIPVVYSLDRGVWIGVGVSAAYLATRLAARGKVGMLAAISAAAAIAGIIVILSPLHTIISGRLTSDQNSNSIRSSLSTLAVRDAIASPLIGYGDERHQQGSPASIAVGPTSDCIGCGQAEVGSTGQLSLLLVCDGFLGAGLYLSFFAYGIWRFRHDRTPYGMAGVLVLVLTFVYMFTYVAVVAPLAFTMLAYVLLSRNSLALAAQGKGSALTAAPGEPQGPQHRATSRAMR